MFVFQTSSNTFSSLDNYGLILGATKFMHAVLYVLQTETNSYFKIQSQGLQEAQRKGLKTLLRF